ncbi:hypothetical protein C7E17_24670, partial [Stenotrophomonas maltophilia]
MLSKIDSALCPVIFILSYAKISLVLCQCIPPWPPCIGGARMPLAAADWPVAQSVEQIAANLVTDAVEDRLGTVPGDFHFVLCQNISCPVPVYPT